jgi:hypothetical protein
MLGVGGEVHVNSDVPAPVDMHVAMPVQLKVLKRHAYIDRFLLVGAVIDTIRLSQRFVVLPNEDEKAPIAVILDSSSNEQFANGLTRRSGDDLRLRALSMNEEFQFLVFHDFSSEKPLLAAWCGPASNAGTFLMLSIAWR